MGYIMKKYNLNVIVHPERCNPDDFIQIADKIKKRCNDINVNISCLFPAIQIIENELIEEYDYNLPSLTICLVPLPDIKVEGKLLMCKTIDKITQYKIFKENNLNTPITKIYKLDMDLSIFGDYVFLKPFFPSIQSTGRGLFAISKEELIQEKILFNTPYIIQEFIDSGNKANIYRSTMFLGEVLYICRIDGAVEKQDGIIPKNFHNKCRPPEIDAHRFEHYPEIYDFSKKIAKAFPDSPLLGIDVIKDSETKELYVLEVNAGGNVWHFSSKSEASKNAQHPHHIYHKLNQYDAFNTAADALIKVTRKLLR